MGTTGIMNRRNCVANAADLPFQLEPLHAALQHQARQQHHHRRDGSSQQDGLSGHSVAPGRNCPRRPPGKSRAAAPMATTENISYTSHSRYARGGDCGQMFGPEVVAGQHAIRQTDQQAEKLLQHDRQCQSQQGAKGSGGYHQRRLQDKKPILTRPQRGQDLFGLSRSAQRANLMGRKMSRSPATGTLRIIPLQAVFSNEKIESILSSIHSLALFLVRFQHLAAGIQILNFALAPSMSFPCVTTTKRSGIIIRASPPDQRRAFPTAAADHHQGLRTHESTHWVFGVGPALACSRPG